jgi:L-ornithine N5-oxygenase
MRGFGFKPQDDTHFVNELFFPESTDLFFNLPEKERQELLKRHADVTHSAVDIDLIPILYDAMYNDLVSGRNRLELCRFLEFCEVRGGEGELAARFRHLHSNLMTEIACDAVILATGYKRRTPLQILKSLSAYLDCTEDGYKVDRCYSVVGSPQFRPKIFIEGYCENTHGFSEILL